MSYDFSNFEETTTKEPLRDFVNTRGGIFESAEHNFYLKRLNEII